MIKFVKFVSYTGRFSRGLGLFSMGINRERLRPLCIEFLAKL